MNFHISRALRTALLGAVTTVILITSAFAASYKTTMCVYMREQPNTSSAALKVVKPGAKVQAIKKSSDGQWMKVSYGTKQGYIYAKFLKALETPQVESSAGTTVVPDSGSTVLPSYFPSTDLQADADRNGVSLGQFKLTFYCGCVSCSEQWGKQTATGTTCVEGRTIAVDPRVIPYGTRVHIDGFGDFVAEDCGGAIKGNHIDIYLEDHARCNALGVKYANVTVLN